VTRAIEVRALRHAFRGPAGEVVVLDGVDLDVEVGERVAVIGRSGSGKSTLLALLGGLDQVQSGEVTVAGCSLAGMGGNDLARFRSSSIGFVFQHFGLLDALTARENVEMAAALAGVPLGERRRRADELLDRVELTERRHHRPAALSGGERQRVAIARALVNRPSVLLADEPTGNLDDVSAQVVGDLLADLAGSRDAAVVVVTHDVALARSAERQLHLRAGTLE
jgi:ABC-type lipoprotein export system ATPase subunit